MKKLTFLPLFLVAPLLVGCGNNVKAPRFAKNGNEVDAAKFTTDITEKYAAAAFSKEDKIQSLVFKAESASKVVEKVVREDKLVVNDRKQFSKASNSISYDQANALIQGNSKESAKLTVNTQYEKFSQATNSSIDMFFQEYAKGESKYLVLGNKKAKELNSITKIVDPLTIADLQDAQIKAALSSAGSSLTTLIADYATASDEEKNNYKFYENGNIFTIEYKLERSEDHKDGSDEVDYKTKETFSEKAQLDMTDGAWVSMYYYEETYEAEYVKDFGDHLKGEKETISTTRMNSAKANYKNVKLKAVNVDGYVDDIK